MFTKLISSLPPNLRDNIRGIKRFSFFNKEHPDNQLLIFFADGSTFHGGLTDRLKGIISLFAYSKLKQIDFRIAYTSPFELNNFLLPNTYDWTFREDEKISYNIFESKYVFLIGDPYAERLINLRTKKQLHCLANRDIVSVLQKDCIDPIEWGEYFKILFRPSDKLQERINYFKSIISDEYISIVFRFQNLLGDFEEYNKPALPHKFKEELIHKCVNVIKKIQFNRKDKILITSDSQYFLSRISTKENIFVFPEKVVHIDNSKNESDEVYMKSFVDFFLLSGSKKIFSVGTKAMYPTEFPEYAAKINNIQFERILID